jgi:hypothetical protein
MSKKGLKALYSWFSNACENNFVGGWMYAYLIFIYDFPIYKRVVEDEYCLLLF